MRGRGIRILIISVVVLAGLFVAADRIALSYAESTAADKIQSSKGLSSKPSVSIKGFPFLTQVLGRKLDEVTATATNLQTGQGSSGSGSGGSAPLKIARFTADMHGVVIDSNFSSAVADTATGSALISYGDLSKAAGSGVTLAYGGKDSSGKGQVKITADVNYQGINVPVTADGQVQLSGGKSLSMHAKNIQALGFIPVPDSMVRQQTDFSGDLSGLPTGISLQDAQATPDGVVVSATGTHVHLTG